MEKKTEKAVNKGKSIVVLTYSKFLTKVTLSKNEGIMYIILNKRCNLKNCSCRETKEANPCKTHKK